VLGGRGQAVGAVRVVGRGLAGLVQQAVVDVGAVADAGRFDHRGEDGAMAEARGDGAGEFAHQHRLVGGAEAGGGAGGDLELARAVFGEERVGRDAGGAHGGEQGAAECALAAEGVEGVGRAKAVLDAGVDHLLLEGGEQGQVEL